MPDIEGSRKPPADERHPAAEGRWRRHRSSWTIWQVREGQRSIWKCVICQEKKEGRD